MRFVWRGKLRARAEDVDFALGTTTDPDINVASRRLQVTTQISATLQCNFSVSSDGSHLQAPPAACKQGAMDGCPDASNP